MCVRERDCYFEKGAQGGPRREGNIGAETCFGARGMSVGICMYLYVWVCEWPGLEAQLFLYLVSVLCGPFPK